MSALDNSRFMHITHGLDDCNCCEERKPVLYIVSLSATICICLDCLPSLFEKMAQTSIHISWLTKEWTQGKKDE